METPKRMSVGANGNRIALTPDTVSSTPSPRTNKSLREPKETKTSIMNHILINAIVFLFGISIGGMIYSSRGCFAGADWSTTFAGGDIMDAPSQIRGGRDDDRISPTTQNRGLFDEMHNKLYNIANKPVVLPRRQYKLGDVKETGGGLQDSDRELLGSLYYNASSVFEFGLGESTEIAGEFYVPITGIVDLDIYVFEEVSNQ